MFKKIGAIIRFFFDNFLSLTVLSIQKDWIKLRICVAFRSRINNILGSLFFVWV